MHTVYKTVKKILDESEFVGDRFADEARSIHRGDAPDRLITGTPTSEAVSYTHLDVYKRQLLVNKASSVFYVYTYKNVWDRDLKRSKRGESKK